MPCVYLPGPAPAVTVANSINADNENAHWPYSGRSCHLYNLFSIINILQKPYYSNKMSPDYEDFMYVCIILLF
jgi:hypothetical protein